MGETAREISFGMKDKQVNPSKRSLNDRFNDSLDLTILHYALWFVVRLGI